MPTPKRSGSSDTAQLPASPGLADTIIGDAILSPRSLDDTHIPYASPAPSTEDSTALPNPSPAVRPDITVVTALICEQLRVDAGAASALRIADTFLVRSLPLSLPVAVLVRVRGAPGRYEISLSVEGDRKRLHTAVIEIAAGTGPYRTILIPSLTLTLTHTGEQRLMIMSGPTNIGSLPMYVRQQS